MSWYRTRFGRDGIDDRGGAHEGDRPPLLAASSCPWNNGQWHWADQQAVFGRGWAKADDIVGARVHATACSTTRRGSSTTTSRARSTRCSPTSSARLIDLAYPGGRDTSFTRWKIGEDTPIGVFRDMHDPTRHGHADRVRSPRWHSGTADNGGVHRNSGVGNKAAYLIASGGTFNGQNIEGIGVERMARLYYVVMSEWLTSASDYADLGDALERRLRRPASGASASRAPHCTAVSRAVTATQMHLRPLELAPSEAPVCGAGRDAAGRLQRRPRGHRARAAGGTRGSSARRAAGTTRRTRTTTRPGTGPGPRAATRTSTASTGARAATRSCGCVQPIAAPAGGRVPPLRARLFVRQGREAVRRRPRRDPASTAASGAASTRSSRTAATTAAIASGTGNPLRGRRAFTGESHGYGASRIDLSDLRRPDARAALPPRDATARAAATAGTSTTCASTPASPPSLGPRQRGTLGQGDWTSSSTSAVRSSPFFFQRGELRRAQPSPATPMTATVRPSGPDETWTLRRFWTPWPSSAPHRACGRCRARPCRRT